MPTRNVNLTADELDRYVATRIESGRVTENASEVMRGSSAHPGARRGAAV